MLQPGSPEWLAARCGSIGASDVARMMRRTTRGAYSADREGLLAEKVLERLTGVAVDRVKTAAMIQGLEREGPARMTYALIKGVEVVEIEPTPHPSIRGSHASPDGLVGDRGLVEIKCPQPAAHLNTLLTEAISEDYLVQMQWQMAVTGREWCDYASFNPDFPPEMRLWVRRVPRDTKRIAELEREMKVFVKEIGLRIDRLASRYEKAA